MTVTRRTIAILAALAALATFAVGVAVATDTFDDVADDNVHHDNVSWAATNGIVEGYDTDPPTFGPRDDIKRDQAASMFRRYDDRVQALIADAVEPGPPGAPGEPGEDAVVSVTAATSVVDHDDSGVHGVWATDNFTRTITVTRQHAAKAANCDDATTCWFYTADVVDNGTFQTNPDALSPEAGVEINGTVTGGFAGVNRVEFYASSDAPANVDYPVEVDNNARTSDPFWYASFFAADTTVAGVELVNWRWTYNAPATCETWVNAQAGNEGDIAGVNRC